MGVLRGDFSDFFRQREIFFRHYFFLGVSVYFSSWEFWKVFGVLRVRRLFLAFNFSLRGSTIRRVISGGKDFYRIFAEGEVIDTIIDSYSLVF